MRRDLITGGQPCPREVALAAPAKSERDHLARNFDRPVVQESDHLSTEHRLRTWHQPRLWQYVMPDARGFNADLKRPVRNVVVHGVGGWIDAPEQSVDRILVGPMERISSSLVQTRHARDKLLHSVECLLDLRNQIVCQDERAGVEVRVVVGLGVTQQRPVRMSPILLRVHEHDGLMFEKVVDRTPEDQVGIQHHRDLGPHAEGPEHLQEFRWRFSRGREKMDVLLDDLALLRGQTAIGDVESLTVPNLEKRVHERNKGDEVLAVAHNEERASLIRAGVVHLRLRQ